jgi:predicted HAD superfamily Cof-like phosphohydrolase
MIDRETFEFRVKFIEEELTEYREAYEKGDLEGCFDALVDLKYVVDGTADMHGFPMDEGTREVQNANMAKRRAASAGESKRGSSLDVVKPDGWQPPQMDEVLRDAGARHITLDDYKREIEMDLAESEELEDEVVLTGEAFSVVKNAYRYNVPAKYTAKRVFDVLA